MTNDPRFDACLPLILKEEGGNDDDPQDHGGRTSRGIIQREYTAWRIKHGLADRDVWSASDDEIRTIYLDEYWLPRGPKLHPGVDLVWFNFAVNAGPGEAYKLLLRSIGPDNADDDAATVGRMCDAGEAFYRGLGQFPRYGKGWTARTGRIRAAALTMTVQPVTKPQPQPQPAPPQESSQMNPMILVQLFTMIPQLVAAVQAIMSSDSAHTIESAVQALTAHNTPGLPNVAVLGPAAVAK